MRRLRTILLMLCFLASSSTFVFSGEPDKKLHEKCLYPSMQIESKVGRGTGTAFVVRSEKVSENVYRNAAITCAHVVNQSGGYFIRKGEYKDWSRLDSMTTYPCVTYGKNSKGDFALILFTTDKEMPTVELDFDPKLYIGNDLFRIGWGLGDEARLDVGKLTSLNGKVIARSTDGRSRVILDNTYRTSIPTVPGDSGSAVFHEYKVVGIMQAIRSAGGGGMFSGPQQAFHISFAVPLSDFKKWDEKINNIVEFSYNHEKEMPVIPYFYLDMSNSRFSRRYTPDTAWD